jgi:4'-phosphopantetheinyl transferase
VTQIETTPNDTLATGATADVWIIDLPQEPDDADGCRSLLAAEERERARTFHRHVDEARYVFAQAALRTLIASRLNRPVADLILARGAHGKPYVPGSALAFNLSRSGTTAVVGLSEVSEIGVDVEGIVGIGDEDVARRELSPVELHWLAGADGNERLRRFCRLWVVREAILKATGAGFSRSAPALTIGIEFDRIRLIDPEGWQIHEAPPAIDIAVAAAVGTGVAIRWHRARWDARLLQLVPQSFLGGGPTLQFTP